MQKILLTFLLVSYHLSASFSQDAGLSELIAKEVQGLPDGTEFSIGILEKQDVFKIGYRLEDGRLVEIENSDQVFEIGSITKTFTASLIMKLVEEDKVGLSEPLQDYVPVEIAEDSFQGYTITLQHLLTHTSGLSTGPAGFVRPYLRALVFTPKNPNRNFKAKHYYRYLKKFELDYIPGKEWDYNNAGYGLLGEVIKETTQRSWEQAVEEDLFQPLGMKSSYFEIDRGNKDRFVIGITAKGKKSKPWEMKFINPAGAIKSTLNDMLKYAAAQLNPPSGLRFLRAAQDPLDFSIRMPEDKLWKGNAMGLGWWHNLEDAQNPFIWHGGASGGYTAFIGFSPEKEKAVVVLSNISSSHPSARAANRIPKPIFLGQEIMRMQ